MRKFGLLGVLLIGLLSVTLLQPATIAAAPVCETVTVLATDDPKDTNIDVEIGDEITYEATGTWRNDPAVSFYDADGFTGPAFGVYMPGEKIGKLIGRVDSEDYFVIGTSASGESAYTGRLYLVMNDGPDAFGNNAGSLSVEVCIERETGGGGDWIRPLLAADETFVWDNPSLVEAIFAAPPTDIGNFIAPATQHRVMAQSTLPGAPVLAAQDGTVTDIKTYSGDMCSIWGAVLTLGSECWFAVPGSSPVFELYFFPIDSHIQQVTVEIAGGNELRYMVYNANRYVDQGQEVRAGCALGETIEAKEAFVSHAANAIANIVATFFGWGDAIIAGSGGGFGMAFIEERNPAELFQMEPLMPKLTTYNETGYPCNTAPEFQDCLILDTDLTNGPTHWTRFGDVTDSDAGLFMPRNSYIEQIVNLPDSTNFFFRVGLYFNLLDLVTNPEATTREVMLRVGSFETTQVIPVDDSYQEFVVEVPEPDPDPGGLGYTVRVSNTSDVGSVIIAAACLTATDHELNPRACYFQNPEFDSTQGWVTTNVQQGNGFIILGNADAILQEVTLDPNEDDSPRTYRLEVDARPIAAPGATLDTNAGSATLYYSWDGVETIGTLDLQWNLPGNPGFPDAYQTFSVDIEVAEHTSQDFTIYTGIVDNATVNIAISRACISTDTDTPEGGGIGGPFHTTCNTIPVPTEDSIGLWTMYHWRNLDKFFTCKLMVLLNKWFKLFDEFRRTMLLVARWWIAMANKGANWLASLLYWLNGHFRNIAVGQVTIVNQGGGGAGIWDVLLAIINGILSPLLNIATKLFDLLVVLVGTAAAILLAALVGIIALGVLFIAQILSLLTIGKDLLLVLINAFNATATVVPPVLPACQLDPQQHPLCVGFWVLENTIFSGTGAWLIPVIVSIGSIHLILWIVAEVKRTIMQMGRVV